MKKLLFLASLLIPVSSHAAGPDETVGNYNFRVEISGVNTDNVTSIGSISCEIEVIEYQDGDDLFLRKRPGRVKYGNITLERGYTANPDLFQWWQDMADGRNIRKNISVTLVDREGQDVASFNFSECWPTKWKLDGLDAASTGIVTEETTIVTDRMTFGN